MLLGKHTPVVDAYSPHLLYPIARDEGRAGLAVDSAPCFFGADLWHAYEVSWLDESGKPQVRVGRFTVPASSPNMVESKSFKLYLNSLNSTRYPSEQALLSVLQQDLNSVTGAQVGVELLPVTDAALAGSQPAGRCIDDLDITAMDAEPMPEMLRVAEAPVEQALHSHLLRSLCPVTGQPDWATVWLHYHGPALYPASLLQYLVAYRQHQEFHEQCVERIFCDLYRVIKPEFLHVQAFYTRRGGLDINPLRSTDPHARPLPRMNRQ